MNKIRSSEITPEHEYLARRHSRRRFLSLGMAAAGTAALAACSAPPAAPAMTQPAANGDAAASTDAKRDELGDPANSYEDITNYNNFYEFTEDKQAVNALSRNFKSEPWKVAVGGLVNNPKVYDIDDLRKRFDPEERIYRLRCVEGWSMVIPWMGFPLHKLLKDVDPTSQAQHVRFESLYDPQQFPGQAAPFYPWPYTEGLRLDEAMNDLTLMATGLYGNALPAPNGAPLRLAVPWKYGFKSIKSIVKIDLVDKQPETLWNRIAPNEYGFYSNVNPNKQHPRWSQATERRIGEVGRRATLMFNGYDKQVADLYSGMDLQANY